MAVAKEMVAMGSQSPGSCHRDFGYLDRGHRDLGHRDRSRRDLGKRGRDHRDLDQHQKDQDQDLDQTFS